MIIIHQILLYVAGVLQGDYWWLFWHSFRVDQHWRFLQYRLTLRKHISLMPGETIGKENLLKCRRFFRLGRFNLFLWCDSLGQDSSRTYLICRHLLKWIHKQSTGTKELIHCQKLLSIGECWCAVRAFVALLVTILARKVCPLRRRFECVATDDIDVI